MQIVIDEQPAELSFKPDDPLSHVLELARRLSAGRDRVIVRVSADGREIAGDDLATWSAKPASTVRRLDFETACPRRLAREAIDAVCGVLAESDQLRLAAIEALNAGQTARAMEKLAGCLGLFRNAQEAASRAARITKLDLDRIQVAGRPMAAAVEDLLAQLNQVRQALEARDMVMLTDLLNYELPEAGRRWQAILAALRAELDRPQSEA